MRIFIVPPPIGSGDYLVSSKHPDVLDTFSDEPSSRYHIPFSEWEEMGKPPIWLVDGRKFNNAFRGKSRRERKVFQMRAGEQSQMKIGSSLFIVKLVGIEENGDPVLSILSEAEKDE